MIEFVEKTHTYLYDGVVIPSVSEIVKWYFGDMYKDVPEDILKRSAEYGTNVHEAIEEYIETGAIRDEYFGQVLNYISMEEVNLIDIESTEKIICYEGKYAGRYDLLGTVEGRPALLDIKTTYKVNEEHLKLQLGLYRLALGKDLDTYCVWLPKSGDKKLIKIDAYDNEKCKEIVKSFLEGKISPTALAKAEHGELFTENEIAQIRDFMSLKKRIDEIIEEGKKKAIEYMKANDIKSFENEYYKITLTQATTKKVVDTDKMKKEGIYQSYLKESPVSESVRITWRNLE